MPIRVPAVRYLAIVLLVALILGFNLALTAVANQAQFSDTRTIMNAQPNATPTTTPTPLGCGQSAWAYAASYPINISYSGAVGLGSYLYNFAGYSNGATGAAYRYNPSTNSWSALATMSPSSFFGRAATDGSNIFLYYGTYGLLQRYNVISNTYTLRASAPNIIDNAAWVALGGKLYRIGGEDTSNVPTNNVAVYTIATNSWSNAAPLPAAQSDMVAVVAGGYIYAGAGYNSAASAKTYRYDPAANSWSDVAVSDLPAGRSSAQSGLLNGHWIIAGGTINAVVSNDVISLDLSDPTGSWVSLPPMLNPNYGGAGATIGGQFYVVGGQQNVASNRVEVYQQAAACSPTPSPTITATPTITPTPTNSPSATATPTELPSSTPSDTATTTPTPTTTPTITSTPTSTATSASPTSTPSIVQTNTPVPTSTSTMLPSTATISPPGSSTPTNTPLVVPTLTPTDCANVFVDVSGNVFYPAIHYLNCRGVINGTDATHYSPAGTSTRGQFAKVVVLGFGTPLYTPALPSFSDVPTNYFAYAFIETGYHTGILSGFDAATCGAAGAQFPCYLPGRPITRAQLTKLVVGAGGFAAFTPTTPTFVDVPTSNVFYVSIETAHHYAIVSGYPDNTFRPNNNIRRDEMAGVVYKGVTTPLGYRTALPRR